MISVEDIIKKIEEKAPLALAYEWDNSGFICGDKKKKVKNIFLTLDVTVNTVNEALEKGADMIISHHPILFKGINKIDYSSTQGYIVKTLIENNIALYAAHTSMDNASGGINDILAEKLSLKNIKIIEENKEFCNCGLGRVGELEKETTLKEFAEIVKKNLNTPFVRVCGDFNKKIKYVAVGGGACDDLIIPALMMGADVMVTSDMKYHISIDSVENGICVIDAGHYPTEHFVIDIFEEILKGEDINIFKSEEKDIFKAV